LIRGWENEKSYQFLLLLTPHTNKKGILFFTGLFLYETCFFSTAQIRLKFNRNASEEALESVMCDVIKIRLKRRITTRSEKGNQPLNIKTAVERPILKLGLPNFRWSLYFS